MNRALTRRDFLAGTAAAATMLGMPAGPARAATANSVPLGDAEVLVVSDGSLTQPMSFVLPDRSPEEIAALGLPADTLHPDCNVTLLRAPDRLVMFDAGSGPLFQDTVGALADNLAAAGIDPGDVTDVVFTHAHPDHIWGVLDDFDELVFSRARYFVPQAEWDFWRSDDAFADLPEERASFIVGARNRFDALEEQVTLIRPGEEVLPGVEAVDTAGHTPGHMSYVLHGGGDSVLVTGDAILNAVISFERPDWRVGPDQDQDQGAKTRTALLDRIAADKLRIVGFHLPHPGIGTAERSGSAYRFVVS
ncbi:MBL fold metallo-hydrolase [Microbaculum sp. FT89]|uniref:MBL fold metallo-hydrolase n=1 Tax=Microbaculum sp. FT89 TaxID=3447298 RepID=UPI003F536274